MNKSVDLRLPLAAGGKTLYAGTETGCIRAYRLPLAALGNDDYQQYRCFSGGHPLKTTTMSVYIIAVVGMDHTLQEAMPMHELFKAIACVTLLGNLCNMAQQE